MKVCAVCVRACEHKTCIWYLCEILNPRKSSIFELVPFETTKHHSKEIMLNELSKKTGFCHMRV